MNLLLDTHAFIWFSENHPRLSPKAKKFIENPQNTSFISMGSLWEMAIKVSLDKLEMKQPFDTIFQAIQENGFEILPITFEHTLQLSQLPFHHRDPFDRILIAQSMVESMTMISRDPNIKLYLPDVVW